MSVWESVEQLRVYTYNTVDAEVLRQRRDWFEKPDGMAVALWWIPPGHPMSRRSRRQSERWLASCECVGIG